MSESQLLRLAKPIPPKFVHEAPKGKFGDYISHEVANQILLGILGPFTFEVQQVIYGPEGLVEGVTASLTATIDGHDVTITECGDCEHPTNWKTQGARLKEAASDALKRCAMRFGLGLHLRKDYFLYDQLLKKSSPVSLAGEESGAASLGEHSVPAPEPFVKAR